MKSRLPIEFRQVAALLGILTLGLAGCSPDGRDSSRDTSRVGLLHPTVSWLDATAPAASFSAESILQRQAVFEVEPRQASDLDGFDFEPRPAEVRAVAESGVQVELARRSSLIWRVPVDFEAATTAGGTATAVEVEARGLRGKPLELRWRTTDGTAPTNALTDFSPLDLDQGLQRYRFVVRGAEGWRGRITELEFRSVSPVDDLLLRRLSVWSEELDVEQVDRWRQRALQIDLDGDARRALLTVDGDLLQRTVTLSREQLARAELRAAVAVPAWSAPARFRVTATSIDGPQWKEELRRQQIDANDGWREVRVPLASLADRLAEDAPDPLQVELSLEFEALVLDSGGSHGPGDAAQAAGFWAHPAIYAPRSDKETPTATPAPLNVILISIDTLRADRLSLYGHERSTSPNLDQWARRHAVIFEDAVAASPWTLPSHVSMLSGLDAHRHGVNLGSERVPSGLPLLAQELRDAGYATQAITGGGYLHPNFGLDRGFDAFRYWRDRRREAVDDELQTHARAAREWLEANTDRPFFLFFHTYAVHGPLRAHEPFYQRFGGRHQRHDVRIDSLPRSADTGFVEHNIATWYDPDNAHVLGDPDGDQLVGPDVLGPFYDSGIAAADQTLGEILRTLDRLDLSERTVVLVTSDHGEMLGEHGVYNHLYLYDENLQIPFLLAAPHEPAARPGRRVPTQVRSVDIVPTLLDLLDLPIPDDLDGISLRPLLRGEEQEIPAAWSYAASSNHGVALQDGRHKVIHKASVWPGGEELGLEDVSPRGPDTDTLQRQLRRSFLRDASGLRLRLQNPGSTRLEGRCQLAPFLPTNGLKSTDLESRCAHGPCIRRGQRNTQEFQLPAGTSVTLIAEVEVTRVEIWATLDGEEHHLRLNVENLSTVRAARLGPEGWQLLDRLLHPDEVGVLLWWDGPPSSREWAGTEGGAGGLPAELEAQLRALGYLQ